MDLELDAVVDGVVPSPSYVDFSTYLKTKVKNAFITYILNI
jgi:hypothetical protein